MQKVNEFLTKIETVRKRLENFERELDERRSKLRAWLKKVDQALVVEVNEDQVGRELKKLIDGVLKLKQQSTQVWLTELDREIQDAKFISLFDESVIVMVFGKVNCGKSTLGNFIAGLPFQGLKNNPYKGLTPVFRVHEAAGSGGQDGINTRNSEEGFPMDGTECTREIQEFTIGGISWVDTPGIHSMTGENGALAKRYVESAELVIYLTTSDSPVRASDLQELEGLMEGGKPTLIAVTKFDTSEEDIDPETGDIVNLRRPKSESSRREQQQWVEDQVQTAGLDKILLDRRYAFLSTEVAKEAIAKDDEALFAASGMEVFYEQLAAVLTEKAVELKEENPRRKFNRLLRRIEGGPSQGGNDTLAGLVGRVEEMIRFIGEKEQSFLGLRDTVVSQVMAEASPRLEASIFEKADRVKAKVEQGSELVHQTQLSRELQKIVAQSYEKVLAREVARALRDVIKKVDQDSLKSLSLEIPTIKELEDEILLNNKKFTSGVGGAVGSVGGAALGGVFFGVPGAWVGGVGGSLVGGAVGSLFSSEYTVKVPVGANEEEVLSAVLKDLGQKLPKAVEESLQGMSKKMFGPLAQSFEIGKGNLKEAEKALLELHYLVDGYGQRNKAALPA